MLDAEGVREGATTTSGAGRASGSRPPAVASAFISAEAGSKSRSDMGSPDSGARSKSGCDSLGSGGGGAASELAQASQRTSPGTP
jgi:hypothetical protein